MTETPPADALVEITLHGRRVVFYLPDPVDHIQRRIRERRTFYEPELLEDMRARVTRGGLCVDVGAHLGNHTVFLAKICGMRVLAFEPQPDVFAILQRNLELNGLGEQVTAVNAALGEVAGHGSMARALADNSGSARLSLDEAGGVPVLTLDEQIGDRKVDLIKIDVEGFELEVLKGAQRTIERDHPLIYAEAQDEASRKALETFLAPRGYVAADVFAGTPVVAFVPVQNDDQRFAALASRLSRAHKETANALEKAVRHAAEPRDAERRVAELTAHVDRLERRLAAVASGVEDRLAGALEDRRLIYQAWAAAAAAAGPEYRPLVDAGSLVEWKPRRASWTVPKGGEADGFLQGFTEQISVHPGDELGFRLSTDRPQLFAKIRLFRVGALGKLGGEEVYASPPLLVPATGVWKPGVVGGDVDLGRWHVVHRVRIRDSWRPGSYLARFETVDGTAVLHPFWVTSPRPCSPAVVISSVMTHTAHNQWGSSTLGKVARRVPGLERRRTVRLARPFVGARAGRAIRHEVPFARWADALDLPLDWVTDLEVHRRPGLLEGYPHVVLVGDVSHLSREVLDALRGVRDRGGDLTVLGAAPGEHQAVIDLEAGTMAVKDDAAFRAAADELWMAARRWIAGGEGLELRLRDEAPVPGVVGDRVSGSALADDDPGLLARTDKGGRRCDTVLVTTPQGGQLFVAGTDRWTWGLDDFIERAGISVSAAVDRVTSRVLGVAAERRTPLVSVIITAYDSAAFIARAIDSILGQTYRELELIVVDDASSDDTYGVLLDYARKDPRVRPFRSLVNHGTYWCKNFGITQARGELVTFQDSDDISLPDRIRVQVEAMRRNRNAALTVVDYVRVDGHGAMQMNRGVWQRRAFQTQMIRKEEVVAKVGYFDAVRSAADQEFFHRVRLVFGVDRVVEVKTVLYHATIREGSLTMNAENFVKLDGDGGADRLGHLSETRRRYVLAYEDWHRRIADGQASPRIDFPLRERTFPAPPEMGIETGRKAPPAALEPEPVEARIREHELPACRVAIPGPHGDELVIGVERDAPAAQAADRVDVVIVSDFRFPGGTSQSNAEEIKALARSGYSVGLVQVASPTLKRDHPVNPAIRACLDAGLARWMPAGRSARARLAVVRHPTVLQTPDRFPAVEAERLVVIVNQAPVEVRDGRVLYDLVSCQAAARRHLRTIGTWFPIGPLVREAIRGIPGVTDVAADDWHNIIDLDEWRVERRGWASDRPVIGRHSRDGVEKWPDDARELRLAYPDDGSVTVRVLGGAAHAEKLLGGVPASWEVLPFNSMSRRDFLAGLDFFVYYHHPGLAEAFGRAILEAIATGAVAILPPHFEVLFGDGAIYARPEEVQGVIRELYADRARYQEQSRRGVEMVARRFSYPAHVRRVEALLAPPATVAAAPSAGATIGSAEIAPHGAYKIEVDLTGLPAGIRGTVRGVARASGRRLFELPINGAPTASTNFFSDDAPDHLDLVLAVDGADPAGLTAGFKLKRRGDRAVLPRLALDDRSVTAALATYPGRRQVAPEVIDRLAAQCDKVFVYLNNYDEVPPFIARHPRRDKIVFILDPASQKRAAAKFHWLTTVRGYHLICDDDILYPPDYAARMVDAIERHRRRAIVGVHGVVFEPEVRDARTSRRTTFKFPEALEHDRPVHFLGTGTVGLHTDVLGALDLRLLEAYPIANDEILAVSAKEAGVPMICIERRAGWLDPHAQVKYGIFEERSIETTEHDRASQLLASANPWPEPRLD